jgi:hypothetical protein
LMECQARALRKDWARGHVMPIPALHREGTLTGVRFAHVFSTRTVDVPRYFVLAHEYIGRQCEEELNNESSRSSIMASINNIVLKILRVLDGELYMHGYRQQFVRVEDNECPTWRVLSSSAVLPSTMARSTSTTPAFVSDMLSLLENVFYTKRTTCKYMFHFLFQYAQSR